MKILYCLLLTSFLSTNTFGQNGLIAEFYDGVDLKEFVSQKKVNKIENSWRDIPPVMGIDPNYCSIRWRADLKPTKSGTYYFSAFVDDGIRVWVDDRLIIDQWHLNDRGIFEGKVEMLADERYKLKVEYFNAMYEGEIKLLWDLEKDKDELGFFEKWLGENRDYKVIEEQYFVIPQDDISEPTIEPKPEQGTIEERTKTEKPRTKPQKVRKKMSKPIENEPQMIILEKEIVAPSLEQARTYIPNNIQFKHTTAVMLPESENELKKFGAYLIKYEMINVVIEGHTEPLGDVVKNQELSELRARKVSRFLVNQGVHGGRLKSVGYGGSRPIENRKDNDHRAINRRVEFKLKGLDK